MKRQTFLPEDYRPAEDEPFMNDRQLEYFRRKLVAWKQELLDQSAETLEVLQDSATFQTVSVQFTLWSILWLIFFFGFIVFGPLLKFFITDLPAALRDK